jgi:hypothetical protein
MTEGTNGQPGDGLPAKAPGDSVSAAQGAAQDAGQAASQDDGSAHGPTLDLVMAALRADSSDIAIYARVLTESLGDSLPPDCLTIERERSMSDRMQKRPGTVTRISVKLGEKSLTLATKKGAPVAEVCHEVRGIVLSRNQVPIAEWAAELARGLVAQAEQNAQTATALRRLVAGT